MQLILIFAGAIGLVAGSLLAAALLCSFLWYAFRLVLHPEWGAPAILTLLVLALVGELPASEFLHMTLAFAMIAAVPLWILGRDWRQQRGQAVKLPREHSETRHRDPIELEETMLSPRLYPAITACIGEKRPPTRDEIRFVASRLWREGFAQRFGSESVPPSFAARRVLLRVASAALNGEGVAGRSAGMNHS